ncbi:hypothetical protein GCM10027280_05810 [Micromonospora polyrhachis]|uniref:ABC-type branched-subunit amino acid transport system substrate-binding protein n=1 Tax=Micromonospora polyrhachis TaxID=1282883 RepID=A0A7W7WM68_9ACTN|nr:ABC transporter substrate-binding protein [Micromonospora polyrhachis]MBB4956510.1 ABC-type branched-subunit amino acid transport system substrate-binding protein [Micromonospora polyrhachis]
MSRAPGSHTAGRRSATGRDRSLTVRATVAVVAALLAFVSCGAVLPGVDGTDGTGVGPGVTADTVTVVFVGTDLTKTGELTGFNTASAGDPVRQMRALESYVNANGGIAGRKMRAIFRNFEASDDSPAAEEKLCNQITQDDRAFAVVLTGQLQSNARPCYAQRHTLVLDATLITIDRATNQRLSPYLFSPAYPLYDDFVRAYLPALAQQGFFDGARQAGIVAVDAPANRAMYEQHVVPYLKQRGITPTVAWIDSTDLGTLNTGLNQAAVDLRATRVERVFFLGGTRLASFFLTSASAQGFTARYGISSYDNPSFLIGNPDIIPREALTGAVGIGFNPSQDVADREYAFPATEAERTCLGIFAAAGESFATRENARVAFPYCDAILLLQAGAKDLGADLNAHRWLTAVGRLDTQFQPATGFSGRLGPGRFAASNGYRAFGYDSGCACFTYRGEGVSFATR